MLDVDLHRLLTDRRYFIESLIQITDKNRRVVPLILNRPQAHYWEHRTLADIILKARQLGFSTEIMAEFLVDTITVPGTVTVILSYKSDHTQRLLARMDRMYRSIPEELRVPMVHDTMIRKTFPDIGSEIFIATAGAEVAPRGDMITNFHGSEIAFWRDPELIMKAVSGSMPPTGRIVLESTPRGEGNYYHKEVVKAQQGDSQFTLHFYPWWWGDEYRIETHRDPRITRAELIPRIFAPELADDEAALMETHGLVMAQIRWRRLMLLSLEDDFFAEFPEDPNSCFFSGADVVFDAQRLSELSGQCSRPLRRVGNFQIWREPQEGMHYIVGADPSEGISDPAAATVWTRLGEPVHCATINVRMRETPFAKELDKLGRMYNLALLAVEDNNSGKAVLTHLLNNLRYPNLWKRSHLVKKRKLEDYGWRTSYQSKALMVDSFANALDAGLQTWDRNLIRQARNLRIDTTTLKKDKFIHIGNSDILISAMIAIAVRDGTRMIKAGYRGDSVKNEGIYRYGRT